MRSKALGHFFSKFYYFFCLVLVEKVGGTGVKKKKMSRLDVSLAHIITQRYFNGLISGSDYVHLVLCGNRVIVRAIKNTCINLTVHDHEIHPSFLCAPEAMIRSYPNAIALHILAEPNSSIQSMATHYASPPWPTIDKLRHSFGSLQSLSLFSNTVLLNNLGIAMTTATASDGPIFPNLTRIALQKPSQQPVSPAPKQFWSLIEAHSPLLVELNADGVYMDYTYLQTLSQLGTNSNSRMLNRLQHWRVCLYATNTILCELMWQIICDNTIELQHLTVVCIPVALRVAQYPPSLTYLKFARVTFELCAPLPPQLKQFCFYATSESVDPFNYLHILQLPKGLVLLYGADSDHVLGDMCLIDRDMPADIPQRLSIRYCETDMLRIPDTLNYIDNLGVLYMTTSAILSIVVEYECEVYPMIGPYKDILIESIEHGDKTRLLCQLQACIDFTELQFETNTTEKVFWIFLQAIIQKLGPHESVAKTLHRYAGQYTPSRSKDFVHLCANAELAIKDLEFMKQVHPFFWPNMTLVSDTHLDKVVSGPLALAEWCDIKHLDITEVKIFRQLAVWNFIVSHEYRHRIALLEKALYDSILMYGERDMSIVIRVSADYDLAVGVLKALPNSITHLALKFTNSDHVRSIRLLAQHLPAGVKTLFVTYCPRAMLYSGNSNHWFDLCRLLSRDTMHLKNLSLVSIHIPMHRQTCMMLNAMSKLTKFIYTRCRILSPVLKLLNMDDRPRRSRILIDMSVAEALQNRAPEPVEWALISIAIATAVLKTYEEQNPILYPIMLVFFAWVVLMRTVGAFIHGRDGGILSKKWGSGVSSVLISISSLIVLLNIGQVMS